MKSAKTIWTCKVGSFAQDPGSVPNGGDMPMRDAIEREFKRLTGSDPEFTFSGWSGALTEPELAVVEDRLPDFDKQVSELEQQARILGFGLTPIPLCGGTRIVMECAACGHQSREGHACPEMNGLTSANGVKCPGCPDCSEAA